jgi:serine/threonine protein kinase
MVFKEYRPDVLTEMDFEALAAMPALVEESMPYEDAERLISIAAWPCAIVERDGSPIGHVMPAIPDQFKMTLTTARGTSEVNAEVQHLLNHASMLTARGIDIDDVQRYSLLREIAAELAFLHRNGICVGDISPKNLLFSLAPREAVYFIDCDTMDVNGVSALPQAETPGWELPEGEPLATIYADSYKLGLLALRLLAGDQDVRDPKRIPARTPSLLEKMITDALTSPPEKRPLPTAWTYILGHAIEEVQHRQTETGEDREIDDAPSPPVPEVRSRPTPRASVKAAAPKVVVSQSSPPPDPPSSRHHSNSGATVSDKGARKRNQLIGAGIAAAVVLALVLVVVVVSSSSDGGSHTSTRTSSPGSYGGSDDGSTSTSARRSTSATATRVTPSPTLITLSPPPPSYFRSDLDGRGASCPGPIPIAGAGGHFAIRGSEATTCYFASSVGSAYISIKPDPRDSIDVAAAGTVDCSTVEGDPKCTNGGRDFVMRCAMQGSDRWVTCTGGNRAVVYIY